MGFYTYSQTSTGKNAFSNFVEWLNTNGVSCEGDTSTGVLTITNFNGMSGSFTLSSMTGTSAYIHNFALVTDAGKELIVIQGKATSSPGSDIGQILVEGLILNYNGSLFSNSFWLDTWSVGQTGLANIGSTSANIEQDATADNYLIPFMAYLSNVKYIFPNYFYSINAVQVSPGVIISDGTKQFISCGLFLFVEYDPATMHA